MASNKAQIVQIVALPDALRSNARLLRIEGEVVRQNNDGSTRLRTPYGDVDILLRGRQPQTGHRLEIDIPAGSPPRSASVRHSATPPQSSPRQPSEQQAPPPPPQNQPAPPTAARQPAQPPAAESGGAPVKDGNTQPLQPALLPAQTKPGAAPAAQAQTPQASGTAPATAAPPAQPAPALPPLTPGQIVTLLPDPAGQIIAAQGAKAEMAARQVQSSMAQSLLQAVKTILPQSLAGTIDKIAPPKPSGAGNQAAPAQTGTGAPPFTQTLSSSAPLQSGHILPPLHAQVLAVTLPSGQIFTMTQSPGGAVPLQAAQASLPTNPAQNAQAITAQPAGAQSGTGTPSATAAQNAPLSGGSQTPLLTVTVEQLTAQNKPVIPIRIDAGGTVRNFIIQAPAASVPIGAHVTLMPLLGTNAAAASHNGAFPAPAPQSGQPPLMQAGTGMPLPVGTAAPATVPNLATLPPAWRAALPLMQVGTLWPVMDDLFQ
ncbi:MAG: hypothetical protein WCY57_02270, partial [Micavibrio sp.]